MSEPSTPPIENFATAPGVTLKDSIDALGMTQAELADRTGLSRKTINQIITGKEPVTNHTALALEKVLRVPAYVWLNLETAYREHLARENEYKKFVEFADWARSFNYPRLIDHGLVAATRNANEKARHLLNYFGVASPCQWKTVYAGMELDLSFRKSASGKANNKLADLSAWLRWGELLASQAVVPPFNHITFRSALDQVRSLTTNHPESFANDIREACRGAGVIYVLVPEMPGLGVSGVTRWFHGKPIIQQSLLFKTNDQFWFTLFHESKHVLQARKKTIFLEGTAAHSDDEAREEDADTFARNLLIPPKPWKDFCHVGDFHVGTIKGFAASLKIHPGIVVGRLLREELLAYSDPQAKLRQQLRWA